MAIGHILKTEELDLPLLLHVDRCIVGLDCTHQRHASTCKTLLLKQVTDFKAYRIVAEESFLVCHDKRLKKLGEGFAKTAGDFMFLSKHYIATDTVSRKYLATAKRLAREAISE